jgi:hypothetical protein
MGQIAGSTFGIGTPSAYTGPQATWGVSPNVMQGSGMQPWGFQPNLQPLSSQSIGGYGIGAAQPSPQLLQLFQILPQQLQQLQLLQQQQLVHLQQLLQLVPAQLQQIQQLIQIVQQQVQQPYQSQPLGSGISAPIGFGFAPQTFSGPAVSHVM